MNLLAEKLPYERILILMNTFPKYKTNQSKIKIKVIKLVRKIKDIIQNRILEIIPFLFRKMRRCKEGNNKKRYLSNIIIC